MRFGEMRLAERRAYASDAANERNAATSAWTSGSALLVGGSLLLEIHQIEAGIKLGNLVFAILCLIAFMVGLRRPPHGTTLGAAEFLMFCFLVWAGYSAVYSPAPLETLVQVALATILWLAVLALKAEPLADTVYIVFATASITACLSLLAYLANAGFATQPYSTTGTFELRGIFEHQLRLGMFTGLALGLLVIATINGELSEVKRGLSWPVFLCGVMATAIALYLSQARSPTGALVLALAVCMALAAPQRFIRYTMTCLLLLGAIVVLGYREQLSEAFLTTTSDLTFSGRLKIWQETWSAADLQSWPGYGFASFSTSFFDGLWIHYRPPSAHNSLLQIYFELGYVGALLMLCFVVSLLVRGIYLSFRSGSISYTLFITLYGVFSSIMSVIYGGKLSIFMTLILLIGAQERLPAARSARRYGDGHDPLSSTERRPAASLIKGART